MMLEGTACLFLPKQNVAVVSQLILHNSGSHAAVVSQGLQLVKHHSRISYQVLYIHEYYLILYEKCTICIFQTVCDMSRFYSTFREVLCTLHIK